MLKRRVGFEIELLAPRGRSRRDLAQLLAKNCGGRVERIFYPQSEPSKVPGQYVFHNLILGFRVTDNEDSWVATCVDDLTLQNDLVKSTPPLPGWYRILSDDLRLLNLVIGQAVHMRQRLQHEQLESAHRLSQPAGEAHRSVPAGGTMVMGLKGLGPHGPGHAAKGF